MSYQINEYFLHSYVNRFQGSTPSRRTGPSSAYDGQQYSYIEASGKKVNSVAILQGPSIKTSRTLLLISEQNITIWLSERCMVYIRSK